MDAVTAIAQYLARFGQTVESWLAPRQRIADQPLMEMRVWRLRQGRLYRQSLALQYVRADVSPLRRY
jgi:hypothetical protein